MGLVFKGTRGQKYASSTEGNQGPITQTDVQECKELQKGESIILNS